MALKLVVGFGNPGRQYSGTRHNVGFEVVDTLAARYHLQWETAPRGIEALVARGTLGASADGRKVVLAKPLTFMNLSGPALVGLLQFFKIELADVLVVIDEADLELGRLRARARGSSAGHNGLKSAIAALGTTEFARLRVGVGRGDGNRELGGHVLARFEAGERAVASDMIGRAADAAELFVTDGIVPVMNRFNRKEDTKTEDGE